MHIKTGDTVEVVSGENKGDRGEVKRVLRGRLAGRQQGQPNPDDVRVIVAGVNLKLVLLSDVLCVKLLKELCVLVPRVLRFKLLVV